ncbi:MAG: carbohydrate ABC transporter substrate-binding protein [Ottowia sp.]|nr:carbohydrate ABC transporter substrate-binding protein [Ottowia sp.]
MKSLSRKCLLLATLSLSIAAQAADVEVLHWWTSGSEAHAAARLKQMMADQGIGWKDFAVAGGGGDNAMTALKTRVLGGNAPTAAQIKGPSIQAWGQENMLANLDAVAATGKWDSLLPATVSNVMKYKGHYVAVPTNVHRVNWLWVNNHVLKKVGAKTPTTWPEFFQVAEKLKKAGIIAIAHGGQPWQDATLFESVVLGIGGSDFYQQALVKLNPAVLNSPTMIEVFNTLIRIKTYLDKGSSGRDWNLTTAMIINGKAGMQFMGDWAKGEFSAAGKKPGQDYDCVPAPGTENAFVYNIDSLTMFKQKSAQAQAAQSALALTVMSPLLQEAFSLNKGSIPARQDIARDKFDACAVRSMNDMQAAEKNRSLIPSLSQGMAIAPATQGAIADMLAQFMNTNMTAKIAVEKLTKAARVK